MPNYNFKEDLPIAKRTEHYVADRLSKVYGAKVLEFKDNNEYDIRCILQRKEITIEVKEDFTCRKTGNVGLEFECRGKPSGISTSKADYYIYKLHTSFNGIQYVLFKTSILKEMIASKSFFTIVNGGDKGSNSMNYLFKYKEFIKRGDILPLDRKQ